MADASEATAAEADVLPEEKAFEEGLKGEEPAADDKPEGDKPAEGTEEEGDKPAEGEKAEEESETKGEEGKEEDGDKPADAKETNRRGYAERRAMRETVTSTIDRLAKPQTAEQLVENNGLDPAEANVEALRQEMQRKETIADLTELNNGLRADAENVVRDFSVFDEKSEDYDEDFSKEVDELWRSAADYKVDATGEVVLQAKTPLYKFYSTMAKARAKGIEIGETRGQAAAERMLATAETPAATKPAKPQSDLTDDEAAFLKGLTGKAS